MPTAPPVTVAQPIARPRRLVPYAFAGVAAAAMVATLPGRTHGLGLVTEPLLADLRLDRVAYGTMNFWATLVGAAFCLPCGWLLDRLGVRAVLAATLLALGGVVVAMGGLEPGGAALDLPAFDAAAGRAEWVGVPAALFVLVLLTRGIGQSALSVVSLALIGKTAGRQTGWVMRVYSILVAVGFMASFRAVQAALEQGQAGWREMWAGIGWVLVGAGTLAAIFVRNPTPPAERRGEPGDHSGHTLCEALATPAFWVFALASALYLLIAAGVSLFNQSLLAERGFDRSVFLDITTLSPMIGLAANLVTGWLAGRVAMGKLLAAAMLVLAGALLAFPFVTTLTQVYAYAVAMGVGGGMVTVLFFAVWGPAFGPRHLGQIQGAAQLLTVLASAAGPLLLAASHRAHGSYVPLFQQLAAAAAVFAVVALFTRLPNPAGGPT